MQGSLDADRLASLHVPVTQLNTDPGFGGECHLDANMVRSALPSLPLDDIDLLIIENVGNLVCPAEFRVGEDARVMVSSVTEGEDKPLKYPLMFRTCELVLVNKIDLLPHLDFDLDRFQRNLDAVHPGVERMLVSARTGEGVDAWRDWLAALVAARVGRRPCDARRRSAAGPARRSSPATARAGWRALCHRMAERFARDGRLLAIGAHRPGALRRAPRRGRVRAPGDRRQARAARRRPGGGVRAAARRARPAGRARRHRRRLRRARRRAGARRGARAGPRARLPDHRLRAARRRVGARAAQRRPVRPPGARRDRLPRALGARARLLRAPRAARGAHRAARPRRRRVELPVSVPGRAGARPRRRARRRRARR